MSIQEKTEIVLTKEVLKNPDAPGIKERLARGFYIDDKDYVEEDCILVLGLNPAGDKEDADREKKVSNLPFLYYIPGTSNESDHLYPTYYKPIYNMVVKTTGANTPKWPWCNMEKGELINAIDILQPQLDTEVSNAALQYYDNANKESNLTIYIGDFFYYHQTDSSDLKKILKEEVVDAANSRSPKNYYWKMLQWHIRKLRDHKKKIKYVYINNAFASHGLVDNEATETFEYVDDIPVFMGGMLSGGHAMDSFSKERLYEEIKRVIT